MTGANPYETSKSQIYDAQLKTWLADKFAYSVNSAISLFPEINFVQLYQDCFDYVNGSHVSLYNYSFFGDIFELCLSDFIMP